MTDEEVKADISNPDGEAAAVVENLPQSVTVTDMSVPEVDQSTDSADNKQSDLATTDSLSLFANSDSIHESVSAGTEPVDQVVDMPNSEAAGALSLSSAESTLPTLRIVPAVNRTAQVSGVSLAAKSPAIVYCQVTSGGQRILVPRSAISSIQLSSGAIANSASSVARVPVVRSTIPLRTVLPNMHSIAAASVSNTAPGIVVTHTSTGVRLLRQSADGVQVIGGGNTAASHASVGVTLNRGTTPQRLAVAIAPANSAVRPLGTSSIRVVAIRNGTPVAIGGIPASGSAVASPQLKLLTPAVSLAGVRPLASVAASMMTVASSVQASSGTITAIKQQTALNNVQAYLRRIEELKSSQSDQSTKTPVTLEATVRTPLKAQTVLPALTSAQQVVVLQSGSQHQLANVTATQLVSVFVVTDRLVLVLLLFVFFLFFI